MRFVFCLFFLFLTSNVYSSNVNIQEKLNIVSANRVVDLTTQVTHVKIEYKLKNIGTQKTDYFLHTISNEEAKHLAWISATDNKKMSSKNTVSLVTVKSASSEFVFYKVELSNDLATDATVLLTVEYVITKILTPYPAEITQKSNQ